MMKSILFICFAVLVCALVQQAESTNVLTCLLATNQSAAYSLTGLTTVYSVAVNSAGTYVYVLHSNGVYRYPFSTATGFDTTNRVRIGTRPTLAGTDTCVVKRRSLCNPQSIYYDARDRLWVADQALKRVVRFDAVSTADYTNKTARPKYVVGVASWTENRQNTSNYGSFYLTSPVDVTYDNSTDTLYILENREADGASRVLKYQLASQQPIFTAVAQGVLGQPNTSYLAAPTSVNSRSLNGSWILALDGEGDLYVVDSGNNRVLRFENASYLEDYGKANHWIGQSSSSGSNGTSGRNGLHNPQGFFVDQTNELGFVADYANNRVVVYDGVYKHSNTPTWDLVLGQDTFEASSVNQGQATAGTRTLSQPYSPVYHEGLGLLFVPDSGNNRVVAYGPCTGATASPGNTPSVTAKATKSSSISAGVSPTPDSTPGVTSTTGGSSSSTTGSSSTGGSSTTGGSSSSTTGN